MRFSHKNSIFIIPLLFAIVITIFLLLRADVFAIHPEINFQGKLTNPDSTNVGDGSYSLRFRVYTDPVADAAGSCAGSCEWEETQSAVSVLNGIFQVSLGSATPFGNAVNFNDPELYLGIKVGSDIEMTPRIRLTASPYALNSDKLDGLDAESFVKLGQGLQVDTSATHPSIYVNKENIGGTPYIIQVQKGGSDVFVINNAGSAAFTGGLTQSGGSLALTGNGASSLATTSGALSLTSADTATWATLAGDLTVQAGGLGRLTLAAGSGGVLLSSAGSSIVLETTGSGSIGLRPVSVNGTNVIVGTTDATGTLLVLDEKMTQGDPSGVNGGSYYNSNDGRSRCYESSYWADCTSNRILAEATLGANATTIDLTLSEPAEYLHCRLDVKSRTAASIVYMRFNNVTTGTAYSWNSMGIVAAAGTDWQDASDSEIQLSGTQTGTVPFSADVQITNFEDTNKVATWSAGGLEAVNTNSNFYGGIGGMFNTSSQITSVQFIASTGNFRTGSHAWCEGRNVR